MGAVPNEARLAVSVTLALPLSIPREGASLELEGRTTAVKVYALPLEDPQRFSLFELETSHRFDVVLTDETLAVAATQYRSGDLFLFSGGCE